MMQVGFHPDAVAEAAAARAWYAAQNPDAGSAFQAALYQSVSRISSMPEMYGEIGFGTRAAPLRGFPYRVIYRVLRDSVLVVAVAHMHRRPGFWKDR